jgi:hypothetical protein
LVHVKGDLDRHDNTDLEGEGVTACYANSSWALVKLEAGRVVKRIWAGG